MNTEIPTPANEPVPPVVQNKTPPPRVHKKRFIIGLLLLVLVVSATAIMIAMRFLSKTETLPTAQLAPSPSPSLTVDLTAQYQNPFDKNVQYANPFESYDNPFETLNQ